jgi:hypothetical protein
MIALHEEQAPVVEVQRKPRSPRRPRGQGAGIAPVQTPKRLDPQKAKVSFYLDVRVIRKLVVRATLAGLDQSDVVNATLAEALSSVSFHDPKYPTRTPAEPLTVTEIGPDPAA